MYVAHSKVSCLAPTMITTKDQSVSQSASQSVSGSRSVSQSVSQPHPLAHPLTHLLARSLTRPLAHPLGHSTIHQRLTSHTRVPSIPRMHQRFLPIGAFFRSMCRRLDSSKFDYLIMESVYGMYVSTVEKGLAAIQDPVKMTAIQDTTAVKLVSWIAWPHPSSQSRTSGFKKPLNPMKGASRRHAASAPQPATESRNSKGRMDSGLIRANAA